MERATAEPTEAGTWQVTLDVRARKVVADAQERDERHTYNLTGDS